MTKVFRRKRKGGGAIPAKKMEISNITDRVEDRTEGYVGSVPHAGAPLAMIYSPEQVWGEIYDPSEALDRGTLFEGLYLPLDVFCAEARR